MTTRGATDRSAPDVSLSTPVGSAVTLALAYRDEDGTLHVLAEAPSGRLTLHRGPDGAAGPVD